MILETSNSSLTHAAYEQLRADLLAGRLRPGDRLKITSLCEELSVGLSAVREALSRLTSEGLVVAAPHRGFRVAPVSTTDLLDLTEARIEIESLCLRRSIAAGGVAWETRVVGALHQLSRTPERALNDPARIDDDWAAAHAAYHQALVSGCDNTWLLRVRELLYAQSERYRRLSEAFSNKKRDTAIEHRHIQQAVLERDADQACRLMDAHLRLTTHLVLSGRLATTLASSDKKESRKPGSQAAGARRRVRDGLQLRKD